MEMDHTQNLWHLPRGGLLISTSSGPVQFGVPPETIKDSMTIDIGVPATFILPPLLFSMDQGISFSELEFPIYYNFFFRKRKIRVVCTQNQRRRVLTLLNEALFGPEKLDYAGEFIHGPDTPGYPDLKAEMLNFRTLPVEGVVRPLQMEDVVEFYPFDSQGQVRLDDLEIHVDGVFSYSVFDQGKKIAQFDPHGALGSVAKVTFDTARVFYPPLFGITTLGSGHGFDPGAMTSGMIIWVNRRGIMVDPPIHSAIDLIRLGVNPKVLDSIILTHCHADHDAGTLQKIMLEGKITLYTTQTIFNSFIRKSDALTDIPATVLEQAIRFIPLTIGAPMNINGGMFEFNYSLHSIPTISLQVEFAGKTMVYSSDTHNDPAYVDTLHEHGVVDKNRQQFLNGFPWDRDLIFHEAGIPPLHTPMAYLVSLPEKVRQRMYLVHVAREMIPENSGLKIAPTGLSATVELAVPPRQFCQAIEILSAYLDLPLFNDLAPEKTLEFLCIARPRHYKPGTTIFHKGDRGDFFYLVMTGQVEIVDQGTCLTTCGRSDFFGEKCLFSDGARTATAIAKSEAQLICIPRTEMQAFIQNTSIEKNLFYLSIVQDKALRDLLALTPIFRYLTPSQETQFFQMLEPMDLPCDGDTPLIRRGEKPEACYFIYKGQVRVEQNEKGIATLDRGKFFGTSLILDNQPALATYTVDPDTLLYRITQENLAVFVENNPGVFLKLYYHDY
jgi:CRP-like cAMP-binding protein/phosphoribosyl 1,2-cyclic phosphodiesterase